MRKVRLGGLPGQRQRVVQNGAASVLGHRCGGVLTPQAARLVTDDVAECRTGLGGPTRCGQRWRVLAAKATRGEGRAGHAVNLLQVTVAAGYGAGCDRNVRKVSGIR